ncbi:hypothetical protein VKT23_011637 [Stygiomarasmius scandens]|uniref:Uncharacterized protein n=1 Tax=Marasmiellus scandens TaxID=2682957 RepID=A0ABR1J8M0_9AGAR
MREISSPKPISPPDTNTKPAYLTNLERMFETRLIPLLDPNYLETPSFTLLKDTYPNLPDTLVWKLWGILDHLHHPSAWSGFQIIYPHGQPCSGQSLRSLKDFARIASFNEVIMELDKMSNWVEEAAERTMVGGSKWDGKSDATVFWDELKGGSGPQTRGRLNEEGPYGEQEPVSGMVDITRTCSFGFVYYCQTVDAYSPQFFG